MRLHKRMWRAMAEPAWHDLPAYRAACRARNPLPAEAPAAVAGRVQWLVWRFEPGETPEKKPRKMPYYPDGGRRFSAQGSDEDRARLGTFVQALAVARQGDFDGIGFAFLPGDGLIGIDLDGMIDPDTGEVSERMQTIVDSCASYAELSPSGLGVHVICALPPELEQAWVAAGRRLAFKSNRIGVEVFSGRQFFTWTGRALPSSPPAVAPISEAVLRRLYATVEGARASSSAVPATSPAPPPPAATQLGGRTRSLAETVALAEEAIQCVPADDYAAWIELGMACKAGLGAAGYLVWDAWSSRSPKYAGPDDTARRWAGFRPEQIGIGTLFALAEQHGWVSPWAKAAERRARQGRPAPGRTALPATALATEATPAPAPERVAMQDPLVPDLAADIDLDLPPPFMDEAREYLPPDAPPAAPKKPRARKSAPAGGGGEGPDEDWRDQLLYKKGDVSACLANAELILANMPQWQGVVGFDLFAERTVFRKPAPCNNDDAPEGEWTDHMDSTAAIWLQRQWGVEFSPATVGQAVEVLARRHRFHPVRDALAALAPWDGIRRNPDWLSDFLGVERSDYTALVGTFFLRGMIKRVMEPGCKFDYCLVLEGEQGRGKSSVARILSWRWFCDTDLDLNNKDSLLALPGHWVYEIAELGSLMKAEERKQKSFLSRQEDEYRPPYGKRLIKVPRQSVFIGTTNEDEYLKDATGGRRFWPVKVGDEINLEGLQACLELLLAEALHDYRQGERCWPSREEQDQLFTPEQAKRGMPEPFEDFLYQFVKDQVAPFSMKEVADHLNLTPDKLTPSITTRIGISLRKLGCGRKEDRLAADPSRRRLFMPPTLAKGKGQAAAHLPSPAADDFPHVPF